MTYKDCKKCYKHDLCKVPANDLTIFDYRNLFKDNPLTIKLPFKAGNTVWFFDRPLYFLSEPRQESVREILVDDHDIIYKTESRAFHDAALGKTVFLTHEAAINSFMNRPRES